MAQPKLKIGKGKQLWPFSRGLVATSLVNAGANPDTANIIARRIEQKMRDDRLSPITPKDLHSLMVKMTRKSGQDEVAQAAEQQIPAFMDIMVQGKEENRVFSRGILARSLEDTGLGPIDAYRVASEVDIALRKAGNVQIELRQLEEIAEEVLTRHFGEHYRQTFKELLKKRGRLGVMSADGGPTVAFSKGILTQSLLAAGVAPDVARRISRMTQRDLGGESEKLITRAVIRQHVEQLLRNEVGPDISRRYHLLRVLRHPLRPLVILIGGVSGTGKSYLAAEIAYRLSVTRVISTDSIRQVMRAMISRELVPALHASTFNAWKAVLPPDTPTPEQPSRETLMQGVRDQVQQVSVGVEAVIRRSIEEGVSVVLEGVHLVPGYIRPSDFPGALVIPLMVTLSNEQDHHRHFQARDRETAASRPLHRYMEHFAEIRQMQEEFLRLSEQQNVPVIESLNFDEIADHAVELILNTVMTELTPEEQEKLLGADHDANE